LRSTFSAFASSRIVVLPTGTGKSLCIAGFIREAIAAYADTRVIVLTHQRELIQQDFQALLRAWPEAPAGIYSAGLSRRDIHAQILFAGIQSIHRHAYKVQRCDLVLIDEAHLLGRGDSGMYRSFLAQLPGYQPSGNGRHVEFMGWRPSDMVRELLTLHGNTAVPRDPVRLAERAFHTTSDFPLLLSAAANKMLLAAYAPAAPTYRQIFLRRDFRDFKPHRHLRVGDFPTLMPLLENGEIQAGTMSESQEIVLLQTFARRIRVTRQMLVNDDLGAFTDFASMIGRRVADFENATAYALVNLANGDGPTLTTGNAPVFATGATRANKAATGTVLNEDNIGAGRTAIMRQRSLDGLPISLGRSMRVLVGPGLELPALRLTTSITPANSGSVNPYVGLLQPVVEPLIPNNRWYLFAEPPTTPVFVYGYLNGAEGPQVTTGPVSGVDGVEVSVLFDFGVGAIDWRGAWFNPGT
jgi:hypothetical protein